MVDLADLGGREGDGGAGRRRHRRPRTSRRPGQVRACRIQARLSEAEAEALAAQAAAAGLSRGDYLRVLVSAGLTQPAARDLAAEEAERRRVWLLSNIANNINQIAHHANLYREEADARQIIQALRKVEVAISQAMDQIQ
ncbi:plasmid mobilization relaxosome protein MobC [Nitrospirillum sp. BR 11752]|uniref:plasmid mobilization protein n=1 Tax=Nitrospirillum sp. BR 11752 TaxID=3104293 RepID=UPI002E9B702B|nr:plasmid mobilization relaxosome protein MobC [Nitrospirillum sp. BR 11752]